ncbi:host-nuclease inhibitor Gam family protein [Sphingomonas sp.]|uniref:host-nuclease inhibitor Gam family protein n=1 Tax=Sphingomonas sp. TaxID=28214 RepID=UPI001DC8A4EF|nr:host-nuclease inhibitor Gam family protein [Sphingomonas sp.]MBX9797805.1 host-nuclease inhibitor Gam family protein [Sphingomonas sp.]
MTARRKAAALAAPTTIEEAKAMIARYAAVSARVAAIDAEADSAIAEARRLQAVATAPCEDELRQLFAALKTWWAVAGGEIAGKRRSTELAGVEIGVRRSPPSLKLPKAMGVKAAITAMLGNGLAGWLRIKYELDKPGIIGAIGNDPDHDLAKMGFEAVSKDEFFIALRPVEAPKVDE